MSQAFSIDLMKWQPPGGPAEHDAEGIVDWAIGRFAGWSMVMTTAFGMEGVVLLDLLARRVPDLRVMWVDTGFMFTETLRLRDRLAERYPSVQFEAVVPRLSPQEQAKAHGEALWTSDPDSCCRMRKVEPMHRAMQGVDVWFAALRREQSAARATLRIAEWDWKFQVLKICPLATWSRGQVYRYVSSKGLPYNELHDQGYPTVGCVHCTKAVDGARPWEYSRDGRWNGFGKTECGLNNGAGI